MTHILIVSRYYPPEIAVSGVCVSEMAKRLVKLGHQVTVLTTLPSYPDGIVPQEYRGHLLQRETRDGVQVIRTWSYVAANRGFIRRVLSQLSFGCLAPLLAWKETGSPDVVIVTSPPLFTVIAGRLLARLKRRPLIVRIADLWPEAAIQLGILRNRGLIRLAKWLEWSTYQQASVVWTVAEGIRTHLLQRGLPPERTFLLTNGVDTTKFRPLPCGQARAELNWEDRLTVLYAGNHGLAYSMTTILDAAEQLRSQENIHFILVGDGVKKADLIAEAQRRNLSNITFLNSMPHERMPVLIAAADIFLVPQRRLPFIMQGTLPVKMFEVMACARPMILGSEGIARQMVEQEADVAICIEPDNPTELAAAILSLQKHPELAERLGQRGRSVAEARFDYDRLAAALDARIAALLRTDRPVAPSAIPASVGVPVESSEYISSR